MGYTHYFDGKVTLDEKTLKDVRRIIWRARKQGIAIRGGLGYGAPDVNPAAIRLNGDADTDDNYETFMVRANGGRNFCKTGQRPYDAAVGAILIRLSETNPDFTVSSDGNWDGDWDAPRKLYETVFKTTPESIFAD